MMESREKENISSFNIVLIGKTGNGKSATGNTLLNRNIFSTSSSTRSCTEHCQLESAQFQNVILNVIDTPGIMDTKVKQKKILKRLRSILSLCSDGFNAFILVLRFGVRFTKEERETYDIIKSFFGPDFLNVCVVVFTCGDHFELNENIQDDFEAWLEKENGPIKDVLLDCSNRVLLFYNSKKSMHYNDKRKQTLTKLINMIQENKMVYTDEKFQEAKKTRELLILKENLPQLEIKYQKKLSLLNDSLSKAADIEETLMRKMENKIEINKEERFQSLLEIERSIHFALSILKDICEDEKGTEYLQKFKMSVQVILNVLNNMNSKSTHTIQRLEKASRLSGLLKNPPSKIDLAIRSCITVGTAAGGIAATVLTLPIIPVAGAIAAGTIALSFGNISTLAVNAKTLRKYHKEIKDLEREIENMDSDSAAGTTALSVTSLQKEIANMDSNTQGRP